MRLGSEAESARGRHEAELSALREHHTSEVDLCQQARRASDPRPSGRIGRHHPSLYALSRHVSQAHEREIHKLGLDHAAETERIKALHHTEVDALSRDYSELFVLCATCKPNRARTRAP